MPPSRSTLRLRDEILAEARARGVLFHAESITIEQELPVLRLRLGDRVLRGTCIRLPAAPGTFGPDVITVHGSAFRSSRMWPRRRDGSFAIGAVVDRLLALAGDELRRPPPALALTPCPPTASGVHVLAAAASLLGTVGASPAQLLALMPDAARRDEIERRCARKGVRDGDLRALANAVGLSLYRAVKLHDENPFEPRSDRIFGMFRFGSVHDGVVVRRFVLLVDRRGDAASFADPSYGCLATVALGEAMEAWTLGATKGVRWMAMVSRREW